MQASTGAASGPFKAFLVQRAGDAVRSGWTEMQPQALDAGEVTIRVRYSSVNYKDALAATGAGKIIRRFPCVAGIDLAGEVVASSDPGFQPGQPVLATSFDIGVSHHGGYAQYARVPAGWVIPLPAGLSLFESMALGTAGFTAALAISRMEDNGLEPSGGPVAVTGATGGVGNLAVHMLARLGYAVTAVTRKTDQEGYLRALGASAVLDAAQIQAERVRPLEAARWAGAVDNVGGALLHWLLATMQQAGVVASVGNAASPELHTTVFPFILRGVSLVGADSGYIGRAVRLRLWQRLATDLKPTCLDAITRTVGMDALESTFDEHLRGAVVGRTVVRID